MSILVVGASGMLGSDVVAELVARGDEVLAPTREEIDLTSPASLEKLDQLEFSWCINCAAYTNVDKAETETELAEAINAKGPGKLADICKSVGARMAHISTDYVFDGKSARPYKEEDPVNPSGAYARSKLHGEQLVLRANPDAIILRTAWLYGPNGTSFPRSMIRAWLSGKQLSVVSDQHGSPTYTVDLARAIASIIEANIPHGIYHAAGPDVLSRLDWAKMSIEAYRREVMHGDKPVEIAPSKLSDGPTPAQRPQYSALDSSKLLSLGISAFSPAKVALAEFARRLEKDV